MVGAEWLDATAPEAVPGIRILPVLHERLDLAALTRAVLDSADPAAVAVELPTTLAEVVARAVRRLPKLSLLLSEEPGEDALVWAVMPGDPLVEALRWAEERGRPSFLIDPDIAAPGRRNDPLPDPHVLWTLGPARFVDLIRTLAGAGKVSTADTQRESGMAHHLKAAFEKTGGSIVALVGAAHANRVAVALARPTADPLARQHRSAVSLHHLHPESLTALLPDPPLAHAAWEAVRNGKVPEAPAIEDVISRQVELVREGLHLVTGESLAQSGDRRRALVEWAAARATAPGAGGVRGVDRDALGSAAWPVAARSWTESTREQPAAWQRRLFLDFAHRCARVHGQLVPSLYEWTVAARGVADDNLAWEVFDILRTYPWQDEMADDLSTVKVDGEHLDLGVRSVRFRRRFFRVKTRPVLVPVRRRPGPEEAEGWLDAFAGGSLCSYPPEDIVIEDYGRFLKQKATSVVAAERSRSEPFTTSMLDGVDLRETLARWHEGRVWVRESGRTPGTAGSIVVVFDDDPPGAYPYLMTWLGEHEQESDMAFYSTDPGRQVVGPGILRATYGGFMLTYPPGRLYDVWQDPDYREARSKAEVLVMAAVDYSREKLVVHVAEHAPGAHLKSWASRRGKRLVHLPLGSLSPVSLRRIRVVHILAGHATRGIARSYIW